MDLKDQVAIITGGGRGLGRSFALALSGAGAAVAVAARSGDELRETVALVEGAGGRAVAYTLDVTDQTAVDQMVADVAGQLGPVDLLVNNAGASHAQGAVWAADPDDWWRVLEVNVRGPFLCARAVLPGMLARHRGRIINVASAAGIWPWPYNSAYATSKAALIRWSEILAAETKEQGISVFAIHPGIVHTRMNAFLLESEMVRERAPVLKQWYEGALAAGRDVPPERAADLVRQLAAGQADALTGGYLSVDDDIVDLARRAADIARDDLYTLRLRTE